MVLIKVVLLDVRLRKRKIKKVFSEVDDLIILYFDETFPCAENLKIVFTATSDDVKKQDEKPAQEVTTKENEESENKATNDNEEKMEVEEQSNDETKDASNTAKDVEMKVENGNSTEEKDQVS